MLHSHEISERLALFLPKVRENPRTNMLCNTTQAYTVIGPLCLSFHPQNTHTDTHASTHAWCLGADCVRMISTISANCDVAFCALTVIIADFTDLHTTLPFPTSPLLLTYSPCLSTASSIS